MKKIVISIIMLCAVILICAGCSTSDNSSYSQVNTVIFDAMSMYTDDYGFVTVTQKELKEKIGEPDSTETWDYDVNANKSYKITTLSYEDGKMEYHFYNDHLVRISMYKSVSVKNSAESNLKQFNLSKKSETKVNNTGSALRYYDCGIHSLWLQDINNNVASQVQIDYSDIL